MKKSARELRSISRNRIRTRSWSMKGLRSKRTVITDLNSLLTSKKRIVDEFPIPYTHVECNEFLHRPHKQLLEDDIPVCSCTVVKGDPESACGYRCLNFLTSNECTPGCCPCADLCKNQRFQRRDYIKTNLVKTDERGWGLVADQDVKAGEFITEYCGEVISCEEARKRSQAYESEGLQDAYIISLSGSESIDATKKGSLARFINHSCNPNCETRKWTVLGEVRVGIFAKQEIRAGTELTYNYNFEWYGGAKVRCRCGAASCVGFLGAKSRGFQKDSYVWEDNDDRYSVENVPLYDSEDDEPLSSFFKRAQVSVKLRRIGPQGTGSVSPPLSLAAEPTQFEKSPEHSSKGKVEVNKNQVAEEDGMETSTQVDGEADAQEMPKLVKEEPLVFKGEAVFGEGAEEREIPVSMGVAQEIRPLTELPSVAHKRAKLPPHQTRINGNSRVDAKSVCQLLSSERACQELLSAEEGELAASTELKNLQNELRPHLGKDVPDNLSISTAEEWITLTCKHLRAVFDFNYLVVKNVSHLSPELFNKTAPPTL